MSCLDAVSEKAESIANALRYVRVNPFIPREEAVRVVVNVLGREECAEIVRREWRAVYRVLKPHLAAKQSPGRGQTRASRSSAPSRPRSVGGEIVVVTPASALFMALYEVAGERATAIMYELLEPMIVEKLAGGGSGSGPLPIFYPVVNPEEAVMPLLPLLRGAAEALGGCPDAFARSLSRVLCSRTKYAPMRESEARKCASRVESIIRRGCRG